MKQHTQDWRNRFEEFYFNEDYDGTALEIMLFIEHELSSQLLPLYEEVEDTKKDAKWFIDNYFTAENAFPTFDKEKDLWVAIVVKEQYNKALSDILQIIKNKMEK